MPDVIYSAKPGLVMGFHGCEQSVRDQIIADKTMLQASKNRYDWLGQGYYFWQNNYERALDFATAPPGKKKFLQPAVLGAVLDLGHCLDLMDKKWIDLVKFSYESLKKSAHNESQLPKNWDTQNSKDNVLRELDCRVIENIHHMNNKYGNPPFDSVRGVFIEGEPLYKNAGFHSKTHIQICIRNPNCIKGFFVPRKEVIWP
ncbi:hypothetical protein [Chitinophaga sp. YIM B06452]|uniref:hypothetical protein n=1 Tax=Chitinophaga sp. YIM B06452 TaxID=3082158 RepID=UPI0031FE6795